MLSDEEGRRLLYRYRKGKCSPEEERLVAQWYQQQLDTSEWHFDSQEEADTGDRIKARIDQHLGLKAHSLRIRRRKRWYLTAAAAAVLVVLLAGGYRLFVSSETPPSLAENAIKKDIPPGNNSAVLTLSNGQKVVLDQAGNGQLAGQGNSPIVKADSGLLTYKGEGNALQEDAPLTYNTLSTPRGGQYQLVLSDGTKVWLNAASSIRYPVRFAAKTRSVEVSGEAYFEVAQDAKRPFLVRKANTEIQVLGTRFNINAYEDEPVMKITLLEGSVRVTAQMKANGHLDERSKLLAPGQQAQVEKNGQLNVFKNTNVKQVIAWKEGRIDFTDADVKSIMRKISRWYDVDVVYEGAVPEKRFFGRLSRNVYLSTILDFLQQNGVHVRQDGRKVVVSSD